MSRCLRAALVTVLAVVGPGAGFAGAQGDRRDREAPELVLETGGRTGACDALTFTADGRSLLAAGDDKVVRAWPCGDRGLDAAGAGALRWSIWREQRGAIYALALSPDRGNSRVAVGGLGTRSSAVALMERATGKVLQTVVPRGAEGQNFYGVMAIAFAPSGSQVAYGTADGSVWLWDLQGAPGKNNRRLGRHAGDATFNRVRLVAFLADGRLISADENGQVLRWDTAPGSAPSELIRFDVGHTLFRVVLSPDRQWLAAAAKGPLIAVRSLDGRRANDITLNKGQFPRSLAFDPQGRRLAAGIGSVPADAAFYREADDLLVLYDLGQQPPRPSPGPKHAYRADALAFHPDGRLAVAGGNHHEVTLWDLARPEKPITQIQGVGTSLWGVALSENGRYLAFHDQREPAPADPNHRGKGPWRVFDLQRRRFAQPRDPKWLEARSTAGGWTVQASIKDPYVWFAVAPDGTRHALPLDRDRDGMPRCFTFLTARDGKPVRLAVGHYWGLSLFELTAEGPRRSRLCTGHQGEVMALAASADQKWLVSASVDQTIAAWSLEDWSAEAELGASFRLKQGKLVVETIDAGSPAWEAGLLAGDEVAFLAFAARPVEGGPTAWLERLRQPVPGKEFYFRVRRSGKEQELLTTVRQRPLWRFFPTREGEWVLWMWRNYYYDTSTHGDSFLGWHVNHSDLDREPTFYRAEQFRKQFHRPDVIDKLLATGRVEKALPAESLLPIDLGGMEPPAVRVELAGGGIVDCEVKVLLVASPRGDNPDHLPRQVELWINDFRYRTWQAEGRPFRQEVRIPASLLRPGANELVLQTYNRLGGRAEAAVSVVGPVATEKPRLFGVIVGIDDYEQARPGPDGQRFLGNLKGARKDAEAMHANWNRQKGRLYRDADVLLSVNRNVTREALLARLRALQKEARPDDRLILFLAGHGDLRVQKAGSTFVFCCPDYDPVRFEQTGITSGDLYEALAALPCRKVIFLDACRSGEMALNPVRTLTPGNRGPVILAACDRSQNSYEHRVHDHGLFTYAILEALGKAFGRADQDADGRLDAGEIFAHVKERMPALLRENEREDQQHPASFPRVLRAADRFPLVEHVPQ